MSQMILQRVVAVAYLNQQQVRSHRRTAKKRNFTFIHRIFLSFSFSFRSHTDKLHGEEADPISVLISFAFVHSPSPLLNLTEGPSRFVQIGHQIDKIALPSHSKVRYRALRRRWILAYPVKADLIFFSGLEVVKSNHQPLYTLSGIVLWPLLH